MKPFNHNYFLGYVNEVTPQNVNIHFPSSNLLEKFTHNGTHFAGGNVGSFIVIEGDEYGFLGRIIELNLPDSERKSLSEKAIQEDGTNFHPSGKIELLLSFDVYEPTKIQKTVSKYPTIGAKVFACSDAQIELYVKEFGRNKIDESDVFAEIGVLTSNDAKCSISLNALFGRHCAIVGTTGGGKSWTTAIIVEAIQQNTNNKVILIDATGEYSNFKSESLILGSNCHFPFQKLSISDLFFLLRPTGQSQRPILLEAIRSLKMVKIRNFANNVFTTNILVKANVLKSNILDFYHKNIEAIENNICDFDINFLTQQIKEECIYQTAFNDTTKWGVFDAKTYDYQTSILSRITDLINNNIFNNTLGFKSIGTNSLVEKIDNFLLDKENNLLRISYENIPSSFSIKEITANAIASYLLNLSRNGKFKDQPIVLVLDEAHQFVNKSVKDEFFESHTLDAFDLIAKECRKYGMFLCLSTQMPRDIPIGTLSQIGTFIVHRLINELDKKSIENAASSANKSALSFLPILGSGEALIVGVEFPMPLLVKLNEPITKPDSKTPKLKAKKT